MKTMRNLLLVLFTFTMMAVAAVAGDDGFFPMELQNTSWKSARGSITVFFINPKNESESERVVVLDNRTGRDLAAGEIVDVVNEDLFYAELYDESGHLWNAEFSRERDDQIHLQMNRDWQRLNFDLRPDHTYKIDGELDY
jgi:hypothetical protein